MTDSKKLFKNILVDFAEVFFIGLAVFALAWIFLAEPLEVTGDSMTPTLHDKEQIIVEKMSMNFNELKRGDIIVFESKENKNVLLVKRVVGLPGESIMITEDTVFIDGKELFELYIGEDIHTIDEEHQTEIVVPYNEYYVLGDNRENSNDSRSFGTIHKDEVIGRVVLVHYPFSNFRLIGNPE
jgi:signal peptidase I